MWKYSRKLYPLACGGITLGILQGLDAVNFNSILYQIVYVFLNSLIALLLGGNPDTTADAGGLGSILSGLFA
jgi:hypothetical protein